MTLTNRERVGRALEALTEGLGPFVDKHMAAFLPTGRDWLQVMRERAERDGRPTDLDRSDGRVLLRVITENPRAFRDPLSKLDLAYAREISEVANNWAHLKPFSDADAARALDTIVRLLRAAGADSRAGHVLSLVTHADAASIAQPDLVPASVHAGPLTPKTAGPSDAEDIVEFRDRDDDYLAWTAAHAYGYVINIGRNGRGAARLHRASCGTITARPPFTGSDMKVCSPSLTALNTWVVQRTGAAAPSCGICRPSSTTAPPIVATRPKQEAHHANALPNASASPLLRPSGKLATARTLSSKYDALRSYLAERGNKSVTLSFAEVDNLVGALPRSARLYHLWWRNDDPTHHHCRSWGDAGYEAHADIAAQQVTFTPKPG